MIIKLPRTVLKLTGEGVRDWLDGLVTNTVSDHGPTFCALLTPQGKIIADMFITPDEAGWLIDTPEGMGAELHKRLKMYVLRAPITIEDVSDIYTAHHIIPEPDEDAPLPDGVHPDPRQPALGMRLVAAMAEGSSHLASYDAHRLGLGVPDSMFDFGSGEVFPADADMDELNGVAFKKGCFIGQEVVSRMHRMSTVKKRMRAVMLEGEAKASDPITSGTRRVGDILHVHENMAMALVRLDRLEQATEAYLVNGAAVTILDGPNG